jgi:hypothetical protein
MKTLTKSTLILFTLLLSSCSFFDKLIEARGLDVTGTVPISNVEVPTTTEDVRG